MSAGRDHAYCITLLPLRTAYACVCFPGCNIPCLDETGGQRKVLGVTAGERHVFLARQWLADCNRVEDLPHFRHLKYSNVGACPLRRVLVVGLFFRCSGYAFSYTRHILAQSPVLACLSTVHCSQLEVGSPPGAAHRATLLLILVLWQELQAQPSFRLDMLHDPERGLYITSYTIGNNQRETTIFLADTPPFRVSMAP